MVTTVILVIVTIIKGFKVEENPFFIFIESVLNLVIVGDFLCRVRLAGFKRFFGRDVNNSNSSSRIWNILDTVVVLGSLLLFIIIIISHATVEREDGESYLEEAGEIALLAIWAIF